MNRISYRADIDGLRALAVIPVVLFHLNTGWIPGGYIGVDIFFVISGFLITSILLKDLENKTFSFRNFWIRRIKRIVPALAVMMSISIGIGGLILLGDEWKLLGKQAISATFSFANIFMWWNTKNYWGSDAENLPLLHTWSLSIEEQFYLMFPIGLFLLHRHMPKRIGPALAIGLLASLALCIWGTYNRPSASFYWLPTRAWELLAGCLLAAYINNKQSNSLSLFASKLCSNIGTIILLISFVAMNESHFPGYKAVAPVLGTILIIIGGHNQNGNSLAKSSLSHPIICYVGKISYSLYLWHWPLIVFAQDLNFNHPTSIFLLSVIAAICSYHWIESPTRRIKDHQVMSRIAIPSVVLTLTIITLPFYVRSAEIQYETPSFWKDLDVSSSRNEVLDSSKENSRNDIVFSGNYETGMWQHNQPIGNVDALVLGDSHSKMWMPAIIDACNQNGLMLAFYGAGAGTSPFFVAEKSDPEDYYYKKWTPESRRKFDKDRQNFIRKNQPQIIIICTRWDWYVRWTEEELFQHIDALNAVAPESEFIIIGQPPVLPFGGNGFSKSKSIRIPPFGKVLEADNSKKSRQLINNRLIEYCKEAENFYYFDTEPFYQNNGELVFIENGRILYVDDDHLSVDGAMRVAQELALMPTLTKIEPKSQK